MNARMLKGAQFVMQVSQNANEITYIFIFLKCLMPCACNKANRHTGLWSRRIESVSLWVTGSSPIYSLRLLWWTVVGGVDWSIGWVM